MIKAIQSAAIFLILSASLAFASPEVTVKLGVEIKAIEGDKLTVVSVLYESQTSMPFTISICGSDLEEREFNIKGGDLAKQKALEGAKFAKQNHVNAELLVNLKNNQKCVTNVTPLHL